MQSKLDSHVDRLAWHQESWQSIDLKVRQEMTPPHETQPALDFNTIVDHYVETAKGQRFCESDRSNSGMLVSLKTRFFDGKHGADVTHNRENLKSQKQVVLHRHYGLEDRLAQVDRPKPLFFYWVGRKPLHDALRSAQSQGDSQVIGRDCDVFLFSKVGLTGNQDHRYHLDKATSIPLKVEFYRSPEDREAGRLLLIWTAEELDEVQGYPVVRRSLETDYTGPKGELSMTREYRVESLVFNKDFPKSTFSPELQPGAIVFDTMTDKPVYQVPGAVEAAKTAIATKTATTVDPLRAVPPTGWLAYAGPTSMALGVLILGISLILLIKCRW